MAKLPERKQYDFTLKKIDEILENEKRLEAPRHYLGMSEIGDECWRKLFYSFRNADVRIWDHNGIKATQDGFVQEDVMALRLRKLPFIELHTNNSGTIVNVIGSRLVSNEDDKDQIGFELLLGHFCGHVDGIIKGVIEAPTTYHVWENKSVNEKKFNDLIKLREKHGEKDALQEWDIIYYAQAQIYMHEAQLIRHYLTVTTPGSRQYISVRTEYNRAYAESIIEKAKTIIFDNWTIPAKLSEDREFYKCKWCAYQTICHDKNFPQIHCKTCRYSEPIEQGQRKCLFTGNIIEETKWNIGCNSHIYNPALIQAKLIEHQEDGCLYYIEDEDVYFANTILTGIPDIKGRCDAIYTSKELRENIISVDSIAKKLIPVQKAFKGKSVKNTPPVIKAWNKKELDPRLKDI